MIGLLTNSLGLLVVPPPLMHASTTIALAPVGDGAVVNGMALGAFVAICALQGGGASALATMPSAISLPPYPMGQTETHEPECVPLGFENCDHCEYSEELSEQYGKPMWLCVE